MTFKTISGTYSHGYTLQSKYSGLSITNTGSVSTATGAHAGGGEPAAAAGVAVNLAHGGTLVNHGSVHGGQGGYGLYGFPEGGTTYGDGGAGGGGVILSASGSIDNLGAILAGAGGAGGAGPDEGKFETVSASGYVGGAGANGVTNATASSITNSGTIIGGGGGAGGVGGAGGYSLFMSGSITAGGHGGAGAAGGDGILAEDGGTVTNSGLIKGGAGGGGGGGGANPIQKGPGGHGGAGGAGVVLSKSGKVSNLGTIEGAAGGGGGAGVAKGAAGAAADGLVLSAGGTVVNGSASDATALAQGYQGVVVRGAAGTVTNFGNIHGTAASSSRGGVALYDGGTITNEGGGIIGGREGVTVEGAAGTVTNLGLISSELSSKGLHGIWLDAGGLVTNGSTSDTGASVIGYQSGIAALSGALTVHNFGYVQGAENAAGQAGISAAQAGYVYNGSSSDSAAKIVGRNGILITDKAIVANYGTVEATGSVSGFGVVMNGGGYLFNGPDGHISGYGGVKLTGGSGVNLGSIRGVASGRNSYYGEYGVLLNGSASLTNDKGGVIDGYEGVQVNGAGTLVNAGAIDTTAREAVLFTTSTGTLVAEAGATFGGGVDGDGGVLVLGSGVGTISGLSLGDVTVSVSMPTFTLDDFATVKVGSGATFTLAGSATIAAGDTLDAAGTLNIDVAVAGAGVLSLDSAGVVTLGASAALSVARVDQSGTSTANIERASFNDFEIWDQTSGTLSVAAGDHANFDAVGDVFEGTLAGAGTISLTGGTATLDGATLSADRVVMSGATVTLKGAIDITSEAVATSPHLIVGAGGASLGAGGVFDLGATTSEIKGASASATLTNALATIVGDGDVGGGSMTLVNGSDGVIDGDASAALTIDTGSKVVTNEGTIEGTGSGGVVVKSGIANDGVLAADHGDLSVDGAVTGFGTVDIDAATADFESTLAVESVDFTGTTGVLELAKSVSFTGPVAGFSTAGKTSLDLLDISFGASTKATFTGTATSGTLKVTDGTHTARIKLTGDYVGATFTVASDGHGGTSVTDPRAGARSLSAARFVSAMAGVGHVAVAAAATPGAALAGEGPAPPPALMTPRMAQTP